MNSGPARSALFEVASLFAVPKGRGSARLVNLACFGNATKRTAWATGRACEPALLGQFVLLNPLDLEACGADLLGLLASVPETLGHYDCLAKLGIVFDCDGECSHGFAP